MAEKPLALVTGAAGFIGTHLTRALRQAGFAVRETDFHPDKNASETYRNLNLLDSVSLEQNATFFDVDYIFHLAGVTRRSSVEAFREGNVRTTRNLVQVVNKSAGKLRRFVYVSSQAAAGPAESLSSPVTEEMPPAPVDGYGISKLEAEAYIRQEARFPYTIIRPASVYGPGEQDFLKIYRAIAHHLNVYAGYRDKFFSYIYVEDLVNGLLAAAQSGRAAMQTYFLCAPQPLKWVQFHSTVRRILKTWTVTVNIPEPVLQGLGMLGDFYAKLTHNYPLVNSQKTRLSHPRYWVCSPQAAVRDFNFKTRYCLEGGLRKTLVGLYPLAKEP